MRADTKAIALQLRNAIERALERYQLPNSESAIRLLLMIAAHESGGFMYCRQKRGPALGLFQMEPPTFDHVMEYLDRTGRFLQLPRILPAERMVTDPVFAAGVARVYLYSIPKPLPSPDDVIGLGKYAVYAKKFWNSELGAATPEDYETAFRKYVWGES